MNPWETNHIETIANGKIVTESGEIQQTPF
jgi:hypothetical protein